MRIVPDHRIPGDLTLLASNNADQLLLARLREAVEAGDDPAVRVTQMLEAWELFQADPGAFAAAVERMERRGDETASDTRGTRR